MAYPDDKLREKIEVLDGSRGREARSQAAVRIEDLSDIMKLLKVRAVPVTAAPTMVEYNTLLKDVQELNTRLNAVALALQARMLR